MVPAIVGNLGLCGILFQLVKCTRTERVCANEPDFESLPLIKVSKLRIGSVRYKHMHSKKGRGSRRYFRAGGSFAAALKTNEHDNIRLASLRLVCLYARIHQSTKLVKNSLKICMKSTRKVRLTDAMPCGLAFVYSR